MTRFFHFIELDFFAPLQKNVGNVQKHCKALKVFEQIVIISVLASLLLYFKLGFYMRQVAGFQIYDYFFIVIVNARTQYYLNCV